MNEVIGIDRHEVLQVDSLYHDEQKYIFENEEVYYALYSNDEVQLLKYDFTDNSIEELTQEQWQQYNQSQRQE